MLNLIYREEAFIIIGKCIEVHRTLGHGFLEIIYKDALEYEFQLDAIPYRREHPFDVPYKDWILPRKFHADFTVYDKIILEAKALSELTGSEISRAINYLKTSKYELCLLVNFGQPKLEFKRIVLQTGHTARISND